MQGGLTGQVPPDATHGPVHVEGRKRFNGQLVDMLCSVQRFGGIVPGAEQKTVAAEVLDEQSMPFIADG